MNTHEFNVVSAVPQRSMFKHTANLSPKDDIDLLEILSILKARWKILLLFLIAGGTTGLIVVNWLHPVFQSEALLQIDVEGSKAGMAMGEMGALLDVSSPVDAEIEIIRSRLVLFDVCEIGECMLYSATPLNNVLERLLHREGRRI
jgi:tyrosine-protein kinase Etk/Wzc